MSQLGTILASLKQEKANLEGQLSRISAAINALAGVSRAPKKKATKKKAKKTVAAQSGRKPMTAAQKKLVSARMKAYWAKRKKAKG